MPSGSSRRPLILLLTLVLGVSTLMLPGTVYAGDPMVWREEARSLLLQGHLWISDDTSAALGKGEGGQYVVRNPRDGHLYSKFGVMNAIASLPPLVAELWVTHELPPISSPARLIFLNAWNLILIALIVWALYSLTGRFTHSESLRRSYVVVVLFATCLWNYLRAQSGEVFQVLVFMALFATLLRWKDAAAERALGRAWTLSVLLWAFVVVLVLSRLSYLLFLPLVGGALLYVLFDQKQLSPGWLAAAAIPGFAVLALVAGINTIKFGGPLSTGYQEWRPEIHRWNGHFSDGVWGFLADPQRSVFIYFPPLIGALLGARRFLREHRFETIWLALTFASFLIALGLIPSWRGEWSYGPRYLVFMLPVVSLPCLAVFERPPKVLVVIAFLVVTTSVFLQVQVNRLEFFAWYRIEMPVADVVDPATRRFLSDSPFGWVNFDFVRAGGDFDRLAYFREFKAHQSNPAVVKAYENVLGLLYARPNYFWTFMP